MLYDPKWEQETRTAPSVAGFVAWLETKNPDESYNWCALDGTCAVDLYLTAVGADRLTTPGLSITLESPAFDFPRTFGALLERARALQTS